jgi:hypothetical protein
MPVTLNGTEHVSSPSSILYPKCTDKIQARITKHFRLDSSIGIDTPRNRTVRHANCWQQYVLK